MSVRVDEISTEVTADGSRPGGPEAASPGSEWAEREKVAAARLRLMRDELRTRAVGFDD